MVEVLLTFLESLAEPVIPFSLYQRCIEASGQYSECKQLLISLNTVNYNVFYYLMSFLREVLTFKDKNLLTPEKLGVVFANVLIRPPLSKSINYSESLIKKKAKVDFILHFLLSDCELMVP
eukprot:TRINITY_DN2290_c1_g1_i1.p1 TRINITY_DN2290_c1_g1~~TRINITY_DN2290_c1_g1_i1.p1  ORF type:complete len:121 (+),score=25.48 TRINITY_DN2290_c1_g1_i1:422-784(+)